METNNIKALTGYPSIDKPWLKYYSEEEINATLPECTIYEYLWENNKNHLDDVALIYFGKRITYKKLFENIDKAAKAFLSLGVKEGDIVSICSVTTPEIIYCLYALNRIGATANMLEPRNNAERICDYINKANSIYAVIIDAVYPKFKTILNKTCLKKVIVTNPVISLSAIYKILYSIKKAHKSQFDNSKCILWKDFFNGYKHISEFSPALYNEKSRSVIVYTGGTTGVPKGAVLTNDNLNQIANMSLTSSAIGKERQDTYLMIMPPFIAYGLCGIHSPLCVGKRIIVVSNFKPDMFSSLVFKYKPNHILGVPSFFETLASTKKKIDCGFLKSLVAGGDKLTAEAEQRINSFLDSNNGKVHIRKGYGMTELCSGAIITTDSCNKLGSVGFPLVHNSVKIVNPDTDEELKYDECGEICISGPTVMQGYLNNETETKNVIKVDGDGKKWVYTSDWGYVDKDGCIFVLDRIKRMIIRPDGHNVFPSLIEQIICSHTAVQNCAVIGYPDPNERAGKWPSAYIVLKNDFVDKQNLVLNELKALMKEKLPERDQAKYFFFCDVLPLTLVGKIDYKALEKIAEEKGYELTK